ncbi:MAG: biotin/lipoyl-containing protein [Saprospiraceae bacterium]
MKPSTWTASINGRDTVEAVSEGLNLKQAPDGTYSYLTASGRSITVEVVDIDLRDRTVELRLDGLLHHIALNNPLDQLIDQLGLEANPEVALTELHAPMPGKVVNIVVEAGQAVSAGDTLLVLEAMKMENPIQAVADATIKSIEVNAGEAVEKGALLLKFEDE